MKIDLNCDMGESFGLYKLGDDEGVMPFITSANIACGYHAGDPRVMRSVIRLAKKYNVAVGAHPGWPDLQGFGRREMNLSPEETEAFVLYQIGALAGFATAEGTELRHVKPHGALYNQAAKDHLLANAIARAVKTFSADLILIGLAGSSLIEAGIESGLHVAKEGFPDRNYNPDGTLASRKQPNAIIEPPDEVADHALALAQNGIDFAGQHIQVDTLCLHGDNLNAAENARRIRTVLTENKISVAAL
ncbi:MAG TPA: 5-oxoprolinase subunit PxpA [Anaerolineales bacterium]|nr:5-oxoprolinase subunit PxpA [Anaerolineales bacterium]